MCAVEFFLPCEVPAVDMVSDENVSSRLLVLVIPLLDVDSHGGHIGLGIAGRGSSLDEVVQQGGLASLRSSHDHHLHVVVWDATLVPGLEVTDNAFHGTIHDVGVQQQVLQPLKVQLQKVQAFHIWSAWDLAITSPNSPQTSGPDPRAPLEDGGCPCYG